jgi:hypothetical protein
MNDSTHEQGPRPPRHEQIPDDPQYHDEDQEIPNDEVSNRPRLPSARKTVRRPDPRRRYYED